MNGAQPWLQRVAIVVASVATFARALPYPLQRSWDDGRFLIDNPDVQAVSADALRRMFTEVQFEAYHPLHLLSYWLDVPWFGVDPFAIHAVSLTLWVIALLLVHELLRALAVPAWAAVLGALLCGLHPVQVEAVVWASGRKDALALLLSAASLLAHVRSRTAWDRAAVCARLMYGLALLAKTSAVALPLFALVLDVFARGVPWRRAWTRQLPSLVVGGLVSAWVLSLWSEQAMVRSNVGGAELAPLRFVQTFGHQVLTAFFPARTAPMYATQSILHWSFARTAAAVLFAGAAIWALRKRQGLVFSGLVGFLVLALPVSNLVPMYFPLQDRYLSLPLLAMATAFAGLVHILGTRRYLGLACCVIAALSLRTAHYTGAFQDELRLWGHAVSTQPDADYAWLKLGEVRRDAGHLEGAIKAYRHAIWVAPGRKLAHAALFDSVALRDERRLGLQPSLARSLAQRYYQQLEQPEALRELVQLLLARGYVRTAELPLQAALLQDPLPDQVLERAAKSALSGQRPQLARVYASLLRKRPQSGPLRALLDAPYFPVLP